VGGFFGVMWRDMGLRRRFAPRNDRGEKKCGFLVGGFLIVKSGEIRDCDVASLLAMTGGEIVWFFGIWL